MRALMATLVLLAGCDLAALLDRFEPDEEPRDSGYIADETGDTRQIVDGDDFCGDFELIPLEWSVEPIDARAVHIATVVEVVGQEEHCLVFEGAHEHTHLELQWLEGPSHRIRRTWDGHDHSGFGLRGCDGWTCEVGDIFQSDAVFPGYPEQDALQDLVEAFGAPDAACAHVANADGIVRSHCEPLEEP